MRKTHGLNTFTHFLLKYIYEILWALQGGASTLYRQALYIRKSHSLFNIAMFKTEFRSK